MGMFLGLNDFCEVPYLKIAFGAVRAYFRGVG